MFGDKYDVIVVGAGHAGIEAALATARLGYQTAIFTVNLDIIGKMPCNPAIGGPGKSQIVSEIDALGGEMAKAADATFVQMKMLNISKGPAVQSLRAQSDRHAYTLYMKNILTGQKNIEVIQSIVDELIVENGYIKGIVTDLGFTYFAKIVILATGTYLRGKIHIGEFNQAAGIAGEFAAQKLSASLKKAGLRLGRLKTGTTPRVAKESIDFTKMEIQPGAPEPYRFSFVSKRVEQSQQPCYLTYTNHKTHEIIRANIHRSPLFTGKIDGIGPRYCPSIEDKVVKFPDKEKHQIFIEPEGWHTNEMYIQNFSTSLPADVQIAMLRTLPGFEKAKIMRFGYAVEYDFVYTDQIKRSLETRNIEGLFLAGQINGTSGYEEAAGQGLIAGINAIKKLQGENALILARSESYIGTLIDDLVTKEINEPYRMMTSRSEYRLLLRQDNADQRLTPYGKNIGLISAERYKQFIVKSEKIKQKINELKSITIKFNPQNVEILKNTGIKIKKSEKFSDILKRPEVKHQDLEMFDKTKGCSNEIIKQAEINIKYEGYIEKQKRQIKLFAKAEKHKMPADISFLKIKGLRKEAAQKLEKMRPETIGQATRIAGVNPADVAVLMVYFEMKKRKKVSHETIKW